MKTVVNLYGGPGTGKSTIAAHIFALLKQQGANAELITEYVKTWVWEGRQIQELDQYYLIAKQSRHERLMYPKVDIVVTDAPVWLSAIYEVRFEEKPHICQVLIDKHAAYAEKCGFRHVHVFLERESEYIAVGRMQTEDEARKIDKEILDYIESQNIDYIKVAGNKDAAAKIIKELSLERSGKNV